MVALASRSSGPLDHLFALKRDAVFDRLSMGFGEKMFSPALYFRQFFQCGRERRAGLAKPRETLRIVSLRVCVCLACTLPPDVFPHIAGPEPLRSV